jgi:hypothetical protein
VLEALELPLRGRENSSYLARTTTSSPGTPWTGCGPTASPATSTAYREGEVYFAYSPVLTVEGTFGEAVVLETLVLSILNHDARSRAPPPGW